MTTKQLIRKVLQYDWELWVDRPYHAFLLSTFKDGHTRKDLRKLGVNAELPAQLYQNGGFLKSPMVWNQFAAELQEYIRKGGSVFKVVEQCEAFYKEYKPIVVELSETKRDPLRAFAEFRSILRVLAGYIWMTHGFEHVYVKKLRAEVPKHYRGDTEKYIGDVSFPVKKNAHVYFEKALRSKESLRNVQKEFAWIKVRDGFSKGFSIAELAALRRGLVGTKARSHRRPPVHPALRNLVSVAQELVYYRTFRTDIWHEFMFLIRPLLKRVSRELGIPFVELKYYDMDSVLDRKPTYYGHNPTLLTYKSEAAFVRRPVLKHLFTRATWLRGAPAYRGRVTGKAKIVMSAAQIGKVKKGDVLIAPTTAPSYVTGMSKASAFVTDEGGITSHAAIVAREMKKPCIIGTRIATKIFKDGDRVEVDASSGIVRRLQAKHNH